MTDPIERLRATNPVPDCPSRPIEELWQRLDTDQEPQPSLRRARSSAGRSIRTRLPSPGSIVVAISTTVAIGFTVVAIVLLGHARSSDTKRLSPARASTTAVPAGARLALGSAIGAQTATHSAGPGAAILSTVKLVMQTRDRRGGLPWGMREFQTTRGQACVQVGRVQDGTIGVIGQDGAWTNDHRFHTISPNTTAADYCTETDGDGHSFENVTQDDELASGGANVTELRIAGCGIVGTHGDPCHRADLRVLQFGLLGPDAVSITSLNATGRAHTEPTTGPDGAYLIVDPATKRVCRAVSDGSNQTGCGHEAPGGYSFGPNLSSGLVTAVRYRDGHACRVPAPLPAGSPAGTLQASCPTVGYVAPRTGHLTAALLAAPITASKPPSKLDVSITFTARVAVTNDNSYYEYTIDSTSTSDCSDQLGDDTDGTDIRAGERVVLHDQIKANCAGVLRGAVAYVPNIGPAGSDYPAPPGGLGPGHGRSISVGRFSVHIP